MQQLGVCLSDCDILVVDSVVRAVFPGVGRSGEVPLDESGFGFRERIRDARV